MKNWLIKQLGGYTSEYISEFESTISSLTTQLQEQKAILNFQMTHYESKIKDLEEELRLKDIQESDLINHMNDIKKLNWKIEADSMEIDKLKSELDSYKQCNSIRKSAGITERLPIDIMASKSEKCTSEVKNNPENYTSNKKRRLNLSADNKKKGLL